MSGSPQSAVGSGQATPGELRTATAEPAPTPFLAFFLALVVVWIATPVVKSLAWRIGAIDEPRERGLHQFPTARLGGLAILGRDRGRRARVAPVEPADDTASWRGQR